MNENCFAEVIRKTFPNVTEKEFETKDWFRHAKYRNENEKRRQSNSTKVSIYTSQFFVK
jgi:hypothetical protein